MILEKVSLIIEENALQGLALQNKTSVANLSVHYAKLVGYYIATQYQLQTGAGISNIKKT